MYCISIYICKNREIQIQFYTWLKVKTFMKLTPEDPNVPVVIQIKPTKCRDGNRCSPKVQRNLANLLSMRQWKDLSHFWVAFHPQEIPLNNQLHTLNGTYIPYIPRKYPLVYNPFTMVSTRIFVHWLEKTFRLSRPERINMLLRVQWVSVRQHMLGKRDSNVWTSVWQLRVTTSISCV